MDFESYLVSKRIDSARFKSAEPKLWESWKYDFDQMHPNSFTIQNLNVINPVRRKYQLVIIEPPKIPAPSVNKTSSSGAVKPTLKVARPGIVVPPTPLTGTDGPPVSPASALPVEEAAIDTSHSSPPNAESATTQRDSGSDHEPSSASEVPQEGKVAEAPKPVIKPAKPVVPRPVIKPKPKTN